MTTAQVGWFLSSSQNPVTNLKFKYSEKATNFCEISTVDLSYVVTVKSTVDISQNFVVFSEYMNFDIGSRRIHVDFEMCFLKYSDYGT